MNEITKPCLVDTGQGFSVLYNNRHLYSRYSPSRAPLAAVSRLSIKPGTLILCFSPLLGYGLSELLSSLPENCMVLGLEADTLLYGLSLESIPSHVQDDSRFTLVNLSTISNLLTWFDLNRQVLLRRCISFDCSGGVALNSSLYKSAFSAMVSYLDTWWKNRMTLMILGRNYHRNLLRNLHLLPESQLLQQCSINRPIAVAGAGPSLDVSLDFFSRNRDRLFILAVDAALSPLRQAGILPDAVVVLESQFWIEQTLYGFRQTGIPVFADLTARTHALQLTDGPIFFFSTQFDKSPLLDRLKSSSILPLTVPRLGSVGLVALYLARFLAASKIPVFFTGLDFSWGSGYTHSRGAPWPVLLRHSVSRVNSPCTYNTPGSFPVAGKNGSSVVTNPVLSGYARLCRAHFSGDNLCFDIGVDGLATGCPQVSHSEAEEIITNTPLLMDNPVSRNQVDYKTIQEFLSDEYFRLKRLRDILSGSIIPHDGETITLIDECSYLFTHFPDGHHAETYDQSFLNRIRVEAEGFLKTMAFQCGMDIISS